MDIDNVEVKDEVEDTPFEYHGAPSPELPIYGLISLNSLAPLKETPEVANNDTMQSFDQCLTGSPPQPKDNVPDFLPSTWNLPESSDIAEDEYSSSEEIEDNRTFKDSSTNTCSYLLQCMYEKNDICPICKGYKRKTKEDKLHRGKGNAPSELARFKEMKIQDKGKDDAK